MNNCQTLKLEKYIKNDQFKQSEGKNCNCTKLYKTEQKHQIHNTFQRTIKVKEIAGMHTYNIYSRRGTKGLWDGMDIHV